MKGTISERADDLPLIIHWLKQMEIASIIDEELPSPHGNRKGLSYGQLSVLFLSYVVSQSDHRLCAVEPGVEKHQKTLEMATGWSIVEKDATDDRLADLLSIIGSSQPQVGENIALKLGQQTIRAHELPTDKARSDTTSKARLSSTQKRGRKPTQFWLQQRSSPRLGSKSCPSTDK
ncbi:MAG: hypothetical protein QNJ72_35200 [Pleurocapsa sp. MO_226.B13]|nr:hypothetical protein [Pleurocapsa sp. MO_226.B13]